MQCLAASLVGIISAEPPSGYNYNRPSSYSGGGGGGGGGGYAGTSSFGVGSFGGGGNLISVSPGPSSNEGQYVEPQLLEKIRQLLLQEESSASAHGGGGGGGGGGYPSSQYGVPSTQYGAPSYQTRVVGVDLEGVRQAIQVAQYEQTSVGAGGGGGYPSGPSSSYGAPSATFSASSRPSGSYGAPF